MSSTSEMIRSKSIIYEVDYLNTIETKLSLMNLELWIRP